MEKLSGALCSPGQVRKLARPAAKSRKGQNGVLLVVGGGRLYHGAPVHSILAASRFVDLVYFASTRENGRALAQMKGQSADFIGSKSSEIWRAAAKSDCVLAGPGLELSADNKHLVDGLLRKFAKTKKFVLDAGALRMLDPRLLNRNCCVTPHANEFEALFGAKASVKNARKAAAAHGNCTVLLKAKASLGVDVVTDGKKLFVNKGGNAGMTKGGTGDVLAGLVGAFGCRNPLLLSACAAAYLNGLAAQMLWKKSAWAFSASDLAQELPKAYSNCL